MTDQNTPYTISLSELFAEELSSVNQMLDAVNDVLCATDADTEIYAEMQNERIMLEQTRLYLLARLEDRIPHPMISGGE